MPIRLAVYQRENRPLDGLCAELQCAGYDVFERYTESAMLDLFRDSDVDALLLDAGANRTAPLLESIKASADTANLPVMLIAEDNPALLEHMALDVDVDDVIILPIPRDDLRSRVRNVARLASMTAELERRLNTLSDFGINRQNDRSEPTTVERVQLLLVGPIGDDQVPLIDMLGDTATFTYAATTDHAWHQLRQSYVDMIVVTSEAAPGDIRELCRRVKATRSLTDLPILIADDAHSSPTIETICRDENVDLIRAPVQPLIMKKRLQVMVHQHRLKRQLRGMMAAGPYVSTVDNLTGLYNRGFLYHYLERCLEENRERGGTLSVATCTISGLAKVNDMLGYPVGDQLISQLGKALASSCRAQDLVARSRGASFCVILGDTSENEARVVCQRVTEILEEIVDQSGGNRLSHIHLTIGMAERTPDDTAETLIDRAFQQPSVIALRHAS